MRRIAQRLVPFFLFAASAIAVDVSKTDYYKAYADGALKLENGIVIAFTVEGLNKNSEDTLYLPCEIDDVEKSVKVIEGALRKYDVADFKNVLHTIYLVGQISNPEMGRYGVRYGGTYSYGGNSIVLVTPKWRKYDGRSVDDYCVSGEYNLENTLHAEVSCLFLHNHSQYSNLNEWEKYLPEGFKYKWTKNRAVYEPVPLARNVKYGFISAYGMTSFESDFKSYAGELFSGNVRIWSYFDDCRTLSNKADLVIEFYNKINQKYNKQYFCSLKNQNTDWSQLNRDYLWNFYYFNGYDFIKKGIENNSAFKKSFLNYIEEVQKTGRDVDVKYFMDRLTTDKTWTLD